MAAIRSGTGIIAAVAVRRWNGPRRLIALWPGRMAMNACSANPLSPWEKAGVRVFLATLFQWKRLRRFPRYCGP